MTTVTAPRFKGTLPANVKISLYRICQEALTNIEKHAGASSIKIDVVRGLSDIEMRIKDDGVGIKQSKMGGRKNDLSANSSLGITNMQERVNLNGGRLDIKSGQSGTTISVFMPVKYINPTEKRNVAYAR